MKVNSRNRGFVRGTLVVMADGREKPIEQIRPGDYVLSFDEFDADAPLEPRQVLDVFNRVDSNVLEVKAGDSTLLVAKDQMFIGPNNDWKEVYNHSLVVDRNGDARKYEVSKISRGKHSIFDITVEDNHSLIANGLRVHNVAAASERSAGNRAADANRGGSGGAAASERSAGNRAAQANRGGNGGISASERQAGSRAAASRSGGPPGRDKQSDAVGNTGTGPQKSPSGGDKSRKTPDGTRSDPGGGGASRNQSANNSQQKRGGPGDNSGLNSRGSRDYGSNSNQTVSNGSGGRRKKSKRRDREEPEARPSGSAVSAKLIDSVYETAQIIEELLEALDPLALTAAKLTVQTGVDTMFSHANSFLATIFSAEMSTYDKMELISATQTIMSAAIAIRDPFEATVVTASGKAQAMAQIALIQIYCVKAKAKIDAYTTADTGGEFDVYVDDRPVAKSRSRKKSRRNSSGRYDTGRGGSSDNRSDRGSNSNGGNTGSPSQTTRGNTQSRAVTDNNTRERASNYTGGGGPAPSGGSPSNITGRNQDAGIGGGSNNFA